ncbi:hypothetical protein FAZ15_17440 [Sphingobacterium olei]|uniref:Lipoprotein n=1 Tax=Sphingobacterium olei TaxID=2571155 RepID=A0A4U0NJA4_9SPHI|nr:hypothetical protein [Sphingobacterium olei]TJZ53802.1 hypothetical protein FAZ15_17440 [Sphingobacterium olei]
MKYLHIYSLLLISAFFTSCEQNKTDFKKANVQSETKDLTTIPGANEKYIHTKYEYSDSNGSSLIIQNGGPKGGMKYTDPNGEVYSYAVFWTRIINETDNPLKLKIAFPVDSYPVPSLPDKYFKILIPPDTMTLDKEPLYLFGLTDLKSFLNKSIHKSSSLKRTINPKKSSGFYVVMLSLVEGAHGTMRTGLSLKGQNLYYRIKIDGSKSNTKSEDKEIRIGSINLKNLRIKE